MPSPDMVAKATELRTMLPPAALPWGTLGVNADRRPCTNAGDGAALGCSCGRCGTGMLGPAVLFTAVGSTGHSGSMDPGVDVATIVLATSPDVSAVARGGVVISDGGVVAMP